MSSLDSFRQETREWLEENCPLSMRSPMTNVENDQCWGGRKWTFKSEDQKLWMERMGAKGWTAPDWPKEYGGGGLNKEELKVLKSELARIRAVSYTHLRAHETVLDLVCRLLLEKKKK